MEKVRGEINTVLGVKVSTPSTWSLRCPGSAAPLPPALLAVVAAVCALCSVPPKRCLASDKSPAPARGTPPRREPRRAHPGQHLAPRLRLGRLLPRLTSVPPEAAHSGLVQAAIWAAGAVWHRFSMLSPPQGEGCEHAA